MLAGDDQLLPVTKQLHGVLQIVTGQLEDEAPLPDRPLKSEQESAARRRTTRSYQDAGPDTLSNEPIEGCGQP
jgi:hypothetical protein